MPAENYLVTLRPLEPWFFGSEKWSELGNRTDFYQRSTAFPQQTALLGMLRHLLLLRHGLIGADDHLQDRAAAARLIGGYSFDLAADHDFGCIRSLTPVSVLHAGKHYRPAARDAGLAVAAELGGGMASYGSGSHLDFVPFTQTYQAKSGIPSLLVNEDGDRLDHDQVFVTRTQPGITKHRPGPQLEQAYYRQEYMGFHENLTEPAFAFHAEIDDDLDGWSDLMLMGGQKSPFWVTFEKAPRPDLGTSPTSPASEAHPWHRLVLVSDAFVTGDLMAGSVWAVNESRSFRNIRADVATTSRYGNLRRHVSEAGGAEQPQLSARYSLHAAGSVFYYADAAALDLAIAALQAAPQFYKIGYNYFKSERKN